MLISIKHPELESQKTRLSSDVLASAVNSTVENTTGFAADDYVVFGLPGEELTEIVLLSSVTPNVTLGHTTGPIFAHSARTQVAKIKYNQAKIYTATSEDGTYALLATADLTLDQDVTYYEDSAGTSDTWYKIKYYNETSTSTSSYSVAVQGTGYTEDSLYSMTEEILEEFSDEGGKDVTKSFIHKKLRAAVTKITGEIFKSYPDALRAYTTITPNGTGIDPLPDYFLGLVRVDISPSSAVATDAYKADYISEAYGYPNSTYYSSSPKIAIRGNNIITRPTLGTSGRMFIWYWAYPTPMTEDNDEHGLPYGARPVLISYVLYKLWTLKEADTGTGSHSYTYKQEFKDNLEDYLELVAQSKQQISKGTIDIKFASDLYEDN